MKHRWSAPERDIYTTDRTCTRCGLVRRTRHDGGGFPWIEWRRAGERVKADKTPPCEAAERPDIYDAVAQLMIGADFK